MNTDCQISYGEREVERPSGSDKEFPTFNNYYYYSKHNLKQ